MTSLSSARPSGQTPTRLIALLAVVLLTACADSDKARWNNQEADRIECAQKGGIQASGACFKVDSIIPMTGPRVNLNAYKP